MKTAAQYAAQRGITEEQIQAEMERLSHESFFATEDALRQDAVWHLTVFRPLLEDPDGDEDIFAPIN